MDDIFNYEHPFVCTDAVVLTISTSEPDSYRKLPATGLNVLLYRRTTEPYQGKWCLPGGFLDVDETPEDNICRKIAEKSHIDQCWLEQLYTFCDPCRDPRARVLSIAYLGLMNEAESKRFDSESTWFNVLYNADGTISFQNGGLLIAEQDLGFDHYAIIRKAIERLRSKILYSDIIFHLLPEEFSLTQLQNAFEAIRGKKEQSANFRRKVLDMVRETGRRTSDKGHRPAQLYRQKEMD